MAIHTPTDTKLKIWCTSRPHCLIHYFCEFNISRFFFTQFLKARSAASLSSLVPPFQYAILCFRQHSFQSSGFSKVPSTNMLHPSLEKSANSTSPSMHPYKVKMLTYKKIFDITNFALKFIDINLPHSNHWAIEKL